MLLRLRHAVPFLQKFNGWTTTSSPVLPLARHVGRAAAAAASASPDDTPEASDASTSAPAEQPKRRRSTRESKPKADVSAPPAEASAGGAAADDSSEPSSSTQPAAPPPKRRTSTRRQATSTTGTEEQDVTKLGAASAPDGDGEAAAAAAASREASTPKRSQKKKKAAEGDVAPAAEAAEEPAIDAATDESASSATPTSAKKRRSASGGARAKQAATAAAEQPQAEAPVEPNLLLSLPFEDTLLLPRKAEQVLEALGIRVARTQPHRGPVGPAPPGAGGAGPAAAGAGPLRNVLEIAHYLGDNKRPKDYALPLLMSQYQGYLGGSPDYLYDLFCLDFEPNNLRSNDVQEAAVEAARSARQVLAASGALPESVFRSALAALRARVGDEAVERQERFFPSVTDAQLELCLYDWASASLAGLPDPAEGLAPLGPRYTNRRCAALQLTSKTVLERLHHYVVRGASVRDISRLGAKPVKLTRVLEVPLEGLKAGVQMDRARLMEDMRLGPGQPLHDYLPELERAVRDAAARSPDPGGKWFYEDLRDTLRLRVPLLMAIDEQERRWEVEAEEKDPKALTTHQLRLLFHLARLDRFREQQKHLHQDQGYGQQAAPEPAHGNQESE